MSLTNNYIFKYKIQRILAYIEDLKNAANISYEDMFESELRVMLADLVQYPNELVDIIITEYDPDDYLTSVDWNNFVNIMIEYSTLFDDILSTIGTDLNSFIMKYANLIIATEDYLSRQLATLDVLELDVKTTTANKSITNEERITITPENFISIPMTISSAIVPSNISTSVITPLGSTKPIALKTQNVIGLKDSEIFTDGYYIGRMNYTDEYKSNTTYSLAIENAFDNSMDKISEYEYITHNNTLVHPFKLTWFGTLNTSGLDAVKMRALANKNCKLYISFDNASWIYVDSYDSELSSGNNLTINSYLFYTNNNAKTYIKMEYLDNNPELIHIKRIAVVDSNNNTKIMNYIESAFLQKIQITKSTLDPVCDNLSQAFDQLGANQTTILNKIEKDKSYTTNIKKIFTTSVPAYRYSIIIPEIYINGITFTPNQTSFTYISDGWTTNNKILAIELAVNPIISNKSITEFGEIDAYISEDKVNWTQICPTNFSSSLKSLPTRVLYNDNYTENGTSTTINTAAVVPKNVFVKLVLKQQVTMVSQIIHNFSIRAKVEL